MSSIYISSDKHELQKLIPISRIENTDVMYLQGLPKVLSDTAGPKKKLGKPYNNMYAFLSTYH